jgi:multidrug resistance efflux pump
MCACIMFRRSCFIGVLVFLVLLWKNYASAPTLTGQAEVVPANYQLLQARHVGAIDVNRFQKVKAGDAMGQVLVTDPKILASSLAVIQAEIEEIRASQTPVAAEQRLAMEYSEVRLHWMAQRAELGVAKADLLVAQADFHRTEELFKDKIVSERAYDLAKAKQESLRNKVDELAGPWRTRANGSRCCNPPTPPQFPGCRMILCRPPSPSRNPNCV